MDVLHPLSAGLIRGIHIDGRHQFTESIRGEFFNMNVLVRFLDELFNILDLLFLYFNFLLDGENFLFQLLLFGIVALTHHVEAVIAIPGYANLINLDYLKPLNEVLTRDTGDFNGTIEQLTTDDGNFYAVPFRSDFWVLYYNKDLFDKAGVEYPSNDLTMEDYDALARKMTSGSGDTKVYGCHYHTWRSAASLFSILDGKNTIIDGKYDFMKPTYDMVIAQQKDGICMDYGYLKTSSLHYSAAFENQQCAMVNMGSWFISTLEAYMKDAETKFNWGIVKYPHPAGAEAGSTLGTVTSLAINADSPKAEAAADFINWCVSEEGAQAIAKTGTFPACGSAATAEIIKSTEGFPEDSNSVDALTTSNVYLEMPYTQYASDIETILNAEHDAIMTMSETVDEGIQNMNDQVPAVLG